ncbi:MAG: four helix bundle protein [Clostridium sp.]|jgi:four helix bundle protein|nr:four helix bundle protein [Clostridium sp.]
MRRISPYELKEKSLALAVCVLNEYLELREKHRGLEELLVRLLRAGTLPGKHIAEAFLPCGNEELAANLALACSCARETEYLLRLLECAGLMEKEKARCVAEQARELAEALCAALDECKTKRQIFTALTS